MLESLSGGMRREIQEDGIVMEVKFFLFKCSVAHIPFDIERPNLTW